MCVSADTPLLDRSSVLCLSYSRRNTSDREGGGWNVTGVLIGPGSCFASDLLLLRWAVEEFFLSVIKIKSHINTPGEIRVTIGFEEHLVEAAVLVVVET